MTISLIAAVDEKNGIGKDGKVPWHYAEDLSFFKGITTGYPCIFGRRTFSTFRPRDMAGRTAYVLSRHTNLKGHHVGPGAPPYTSGDVSLEPQICPTLSVALDICRTADRVFVCGGEQVYGETLPLAHELILTRIPGVWDCDVFFPELSDEWRRVGGFALPSKDAKLSVDVMRRFITAIK